MPRQIKELYPAFKNCQDLFFTAFDPPSTLVPAAALIPDITTQEAKTSSITARPSASHDPGASRTDTSPALSPTLAPHVATVQPSQTKNSTPHHTPEVNNLQPKKSRSGTENRQIASKDDASDPGDSFSHYHSTCEIFKQSNDPGISSTLPLGPNHKHTPTSNQSEVLPQPNQGQKPTLQHDLQAAGLSDLLKMSPSLYHLGKQDSSLDLPRSTRDPEKPMNHQGIPMPLTTTTSASLVAEHVRASLLSQTLSVSSDVISSFAIPTPGLDADILDDPAAHSHSEKHLFSFSAPFISDISMAKFSNSATSPALSGVPTAGNNMNHSTAASKESETSNRTHLGTQSYLTSISDSPPTRTDGVSTSNEPHRIPTRATSATTEAAPAASDANLASKNSTVARAQNGTTVTSLTVFRGDGGRLEGAGEDGWRLASKISIMMIIALL